MRISSQRLLVLFTMVAFLALSGGAGWSQESKAGIKLGFIGPLTGSAASYGVAQMRGIALAVEEINAAGGVDGQKLEVIYEDSQMDPNKSISAMKKLVDIDKVPAVMGDTSTTATLAIVDTATRTKTVLLSPVASGTKLTGVSEYFFRCSPSDAFQATIASRFVYEKGLKAGVIIYTNDDWGGGLQKAFQKKYSELGGAVLASEGTTPGTKNFRTLLTKIKPLKPSFIYIPLHPDDAAILLRQVKELRVTGQIAGADNFGEKSIVKAAKSAADGVIFTMPAQPSGELYQAFAEEFKGKYGEEAGYYPAVAYDSLKVLVEAIRMSGLSGNQIKDALRKIKNYEGASGKIEFDEHGDVTTKQFTILQIIKGEYVPYKNP